MNRLICLIPHYNNPQALVKSLASIGQQESCDVLVVDDGSTIQPIEEAQARHAFEAKGELYFLYLPQNHGIEHALNNGLRWILSRGYEWVARLDCGDKNRPDRFARQIHFLEKNPDIMLLGGAANVVDRNGVHQFTLRHPTSHAEICCEMKKNTAFVHPTVMFRLIVIEKVGLYPLGTTAAEDYSFFWMIARQYPTANLSDILIEYELDSGGISLSQRKKQLQSRLSIQWYYLDGSWQAWFGLIRTLILMVLPHRWILIVKKYLNSASY